jgi:predicted nucleotidyltransferase
MDAGAAEDAIERAGRALIEAVPAPAKVSLFGSQARGDAGERSDFVSS